MSRLRSRLDRRRREASGATSDGGAADCGADRSEIVEQLRRRMEKISQRFSTAGERAPAARPARGPGEVLPGTVTETANGLVLVRTASYPPSYRHGNEPAAGFASAGAGLATLARDEAFGRVDLSRALFLDTETTGPSGGTGTLPFLVGTGRLERDGSFSVTQYFCREPSEERAGLLLLTEALAEASCLVTFNGRAFDMPLVNTRFVMNRMVNPGHDLPHLDLLHVARRVFKRRLLDRSLMALEAAVLGFERTGDIPGHAIPQAYADYLRGGPVAPMIAVMEHNGMDLVALAALGGVLERMYSDPDAVVHAADRLGLARAALDAGQQEVARRHLDQASMSESADDRRVGLYMAARHASRHKSFARARDLWLAALENDPGDPWAHLALAKHYEHREKRYDLALEHARRAAEVEGDEGCAYRVARIERKRKEDRSEDG